MNKSIIPIAIVAMLGLLAAAFAFDSVRLAGDARHRVDVADQEMHKHEQRLVELSKGFSHRSSEVEAALASYQTADDPAARQQAYEKVVAGFRQTMSDKIDPTNPLERRFMDDVAGAINRREIAQKQYDVEAAAYRQYLAGLRGRIARMLSSQARKDFQPAR